MSNILKIKRSGTPSEVPVSLEHGELAINYADGKIFYKNSSDSIVEFIQSSSSISITIDAGNASSVYENDPTLALDGGGA